MATKTGTHTVWVAEDKIWELGVAGVEFQALCSTCAWSGFCWTTIEDGDKAEAIAKDEGAQHAADPTSVAVSR